MPTEKPDAQASAQTFSQARFLDEADALVGHPSHVVAGALAGTSKASLTRDEVSKLVDQFLKREVGS